MSYSYTFNKNINDLEQLQNTVRSNGLPGIQYISADSNGIYLYFDNELSTQDQEKLTQLVNTFQEIIIDLDSTYENILTVSKTITNSFWTLVCSWTYAGKYLEDYKCIIINSYIKTNTPGNTYSLRLYDSQNNKTIWTETVSNQTLLNNCINIDMTLLPSATTTLELHCRANNSGDSVEINNICLKH